MNIVKDLEEQKEIKRKHEILNPPKAMKFLSEDNGIEERELMRNLKMDAHIVEVENVTRDQIEMKTAEDEWGTVYTESEIKEICHDFYLRFLQVRHFNGNISKELPSVILKFCKDKKITTTDSYLHEAFYIVAPKESFSLSEKPKDPLLFYRVTDRYDDGENKYVLVHQWGKEFTHARRLTGLIRRNGFTLWFARTLLVASIAITLFGFLGVTNLGASTIFLVLSGVINLIVLAVAADNDGDFPDNSSDNWNSKIK